jgi:hypothetical protein
VTLFTLDEYKEGGGGEENVLVTTAAVTPNSADMKAVRYLDT